MVIGADSVPVTFSITSGPRSPAGIQIVSPGFTLLPEKVFIVAGIVWSQLTAEDTDG